MKSINLPLLSLSIVIGLFTLSITGQWIEIAKLKERIRKMEQAQGKEYGSLPIEIPINPPVTLKNGEYLEIEMHANGLERSQAIVEQGTRASDFRIMYRFAKCGKHGKDICLIGHNEIQY